MYRFGSSSGRSFHKDAHRKGKRLTKEAVKKAVKDAKERGKELDGKIRLLAGEVRLLIAGLGLMAAGIAAISVVPSYPAFFAVGAVIAIGQGLAFPPFTSLYTKVCRAEEAGEALGQSTSMSTAGRVVGALRRGRARDLGFLCAGRAPHGPDLQPRRSPFV